MHPILSILALAACGQKGAECLPGYEPGAAGYCEAVEETLSNPSDDTSEDTTPGTDSTENTENTESTDTATTDTEVTDPEPPGLPEGFTSGDPINHINSERVTFPDNPHSGYESVAAEVLSDDYAVSVGQGGWLVSDMNTGEVLADGGSERAFYATVDHENDLLILSTRERGVKMLSTADPLNLESTGSGWEPGGTQTIEDVSADDGYLMVSAQESVFFLDIAPNGELTELSQLPSTHAVAASLLGDRAVFTDGNDVVLADVSDITSPTELDRVTLIGKGHDVAFDGVHIGVAMGGNGIAVLDVEGDRLVDRAQYDTPGSCFSVSLDGDYLWAAAWDQVVLAWVGEGQPVVLGHKPVQEYGLGVAASAGRAVVADWFYVSTYEQTPMTGAAEVDLPRKVYFSDDGDYDVITVRNAGAEALEINFEDPEDDAYSITLDTLTLEPNERGYIGVNFEGGSIETPLRFSSNDPDESSGEIILSSRSSGVGERHRDMELWGFTPPDDTLELFSLEEQKGKVVFMAYFALY